MIIRLNRTGIVGAGNITATGLLLAVLAIILPSGSYNDSIDKPKYTPNTGELTEGTNLYFTNERVDDRVAPSQEKVQELILFMMI